MNGEMNADAIKKFFEATRIRKYNVKVIIRFLEENIYETFITPNFDIINDYQNFSTDFDNALNDFKDAVNEKGKKYCYVDSNKFIFLFNEERNIVYGFSIENYQYVYDTTYNLIQELNRNDIVFIKTFEKLPYKIRTIVNNKIHNYLVLYSYFV